MCASKSYVNTNLRVPLEFAWKMLLYHFENDNTNVETRALTVCHCFVLPGFTSTREKHARTQCRVYFFTNIDGSAMQLKQAGIRCLYQTFLNRCCAVGIKSLSYKDKTL